MRNLTSKLMGLGLLAGLAASTGCDLETAQALLTPGRAAAIFTEDPGSPNFALGVTPIFTEDPAASKPNVRVSTVFSADPASSKYRLRTTSVFTTDPAASKYSVRTAR